MLGRLDCWKPLTNTKTSTNGVVADNAEELISRVSSYLPEETTDLIGQAYRYADQCHRGQTRKSGEPYIAHPLEAALFLSDLRLDGHTIIAALLHDVVEDCGVTLEEVEAEFGPETAKLVDGVTKLARLDTRLYEPKSAAEDTSDEHQDSLQAESLRKMLVSMAEDVRVVLIKLADRMHNMYTLDALPPEKRKRIAQETLDIYSPLAHRLGIWDIKWRLDDMAFRHLDEERYHEISKMLAVKRGKEKNTSKRSPASCAKPWRSWD